jgi:hypothetical protein
MKTKKHACTISILPSIHMQSFINIYSVLLGFSEDQVLAERQLGLTKGQRAKSTPVQPVDD